MAGGKMNAEALSARQLAVTAVVAGLSPAAAYAGRTTWLWIVLWSAVGVAVAAVTLRRVSGRVMGRPLRAAYALWAVVPAARTLERAAARLELTSGGSPRFWLLLLIVLPLLWIGMGKDAPFFRTAEILWLAMAVILTLVLAAGAGRMEWRYLAVETGERRDGALAAGEMLLPALFTIPYIYIARPGAQKSGLGWLAALGGLGAAMCALTAGILGAGGREVTLAFYAAAGLVGDGSRGEGLLSALWLLPDLVYVGLLCRVWGPKGRPAMAAAVAALLVFFGLSGRVPAEICLAGAVLLLLLTLIFPGRAGDFVVEKSR